MIGSWVAATGRRALGGPLATGALLLALVGPAALGQAAEQPTPAGPPGVSEVEAMAGALVGGPEGLAVLRAYIAEAGNDPEAMATRAGKLVAALEGTPEEIQHAAQNVAEAAEETLGAVPVVRFGMDSTFEVPKGAIAFDFGTPDAPSLAGFTRVTARDPRVEGAGMQGLRRPAKVPVISSGLAGVHKFKTKLPNGRYRVIIMTDDLGDWERFARPLGQTISVGGKTIRIGGANPGQWVHEAYLGNPAAREQAPAAFTGGLIVIEIEVTNGEFELALPGADHTYLSGLIFEPVGLPSLVRPLDPAAAKVLNPERFRQATKQAQAALGEQLAAKLVEVTAQAAPAERAKAFKGLVEPVVEKEAVASPS